MQAANQVFFIVFSLLSFAVFLISLTFYRKDKSDSSIVYWCLSVALFSLTGLCFGIATWTHTFLMTIANFSVISSKLCLSILYCSWNHKKLTSKQIFLLIFSVVLVVGVYEFLREGQNTYIQRVVLVGLPQEIFLIWQLFSLRKFQRNHKNNYISALFVLTFIHLAGIIARAIWVAYFSNQLNGYLHVSDLLSLSLLWLNFGSIFLIYVVLAGFYLDRQYRNKEIIRSKLNQSESEKIAIKNLLKEKERLIYGLMKANKTSATGALSASIAHELNQPLGASNVNIQFLKMKLEKGTLNPELGKEILDSLEADNKRAATIVKSLRSIFTDGDSSAEEVQLNDLISKVLDIVRPELKSKNIQIQLSMDNDLPIQVNPTEIEQVILNLVNNSIQSLANSGGLARRVLIEATKAGQLVVFSVSDNGPGVPPEFKSYLFELLSTTKQTGMGLGLWLCRHVVTRYSGSIYYEDAVGGGAKFVIELPLVSEN